MALLVYTLCCTSLTVCLVSCTLPLYLASACCRSKEQELQQVQHGWSVASQQEGCQSVEAQRAKQQVKALEGQLRDLHARLTTLQAGAR